MTTAPPTPKRKHHDVHPTRSHCLRHRLNINLATPPEDSDATDRSSETGSPRSAVAARLEDLHLRAAFSHGALRMRQRLEDDGSPRKKLRFAEHVVEIGRAEFLDSSSDDGCVRDDEHGVVSTHFSACRETLRPSLTSAAPALDTPTPDSLAGRRSTSAPPQPRSHPPGSEPASAKPDTRPLSSTIRPGGGPDEAAAQLRQQWWQPSEITGHLLLPPLVAGDADDGTGLNGLGFRPTPAIAACRARKRRLQVAAWRAREEREGRARRSENRAQGLDRVREPLLPDGDVGDGDGDGEAERGPRESVEEEDGPCGREKESARDGIRGIAWAGWGGSLSSCGGSVGQRAAKQTSELS